MFCDLEFLKENKAGRIRRGLTDFETTIPNSDRLLVLGRTVREIGVRYETAALPHGGGDATCYPSRIKSLRVSRDFLQGIGEFWLFDERAERRRFRFRAVKKNFGAMWVRRQSLAFLSREVSIGVRRRESVSGGLDRRR